MHQTTPDLFLAIEEADRRGEDPAAADARIWERFQKDCAVLVLDSTGFTRVSRQRGVVHFLRMYLRMAALVGATLERCQCLSWRSAADNLFAEFRTADDALGAAMACHLALQEARIPLDERDDYRICIGIGCGRLLDGGPAGMFGDEMNLACKLGEDTAEAGETLLPEGAWSFFSLKVLAT